MIILGQFDEFGPDFGLPSIMEFISPEPFDYKDIIVEYMKAGQGCMASPGFVKDVITGEQVLRPFVTMHDGVYFWSSSLIYHIEKYNVRLPEAFIAHVLETTRSR